VIDRAIQILRSGNPLPIDLVTHLLKEGVDVAALEAKYA
jgi:hypothetical protein